MKPKLDYFTFLKLNIQKYSDIDLNTFNTLLESFKNGAKNDKKINDDDITSLFLLSFISSVSNEQSLKDFNKLTKSEIQSFQKQTEKNVIDCLKAMQKKIKKQNG